MYNNYNSSFSSYYGAGQASTGSGSTSGGGSSNVMSRMNESEALALLQHLSKEDFQHLLNDDSKLNDLVQDLAQVRSVQSEHDSLVAQNKSLAEYNLSLQPRLASLKTQVATDYETANTLKNDLGVQVAKLDTYVGSQKLDTLHALLQTEAATAEEEAECIAEKFCESSMTVEEFLAEFLPKRTLAHKRRIKSEKMGELLRESHSSSHPPAWPSSSPGGLSQQHQGAPLPAPYPTGPPSVGAPYPLGGGSVFGRPSYGMPDPSLYRR